jgi:hypothetical protein
MFDLRMVSFWFCLTWKLRGKKKIHWIMIKDSVGGIILTHPYLNGGERWMLKHV